MYLPFDVWYVILPHTNLKTLLICRGLCKKILKIANNVMKTSRNDINWYGMSYIYQIISEDFIREFQDKVHWDSISWCQTLSEDFIREFHSGRNKVNWDWISMNQTLSEDFIREFHSGRNKVNWYGIAYNQKLSENFIREFQGKVHWDWVEFIF